MARILAPQVAGMFYPADREELGRLVDGLFAGAQAAAERPKAIVVPHAGYRFSGSVAARIVKSIAGRAGQIRRVVMAGPSHRMAFRGIALTSADFMRTPLGDVPIDWEAQRRLLTLPDIQVLDKPFEGEHGLEVILPFLQRLLGDFQVVPMICGQVPEARVQDAFSALWGGPETLVIVSSDLSHFHDYDTARKLDGEAAASVEKLTADTIGDQHACGRVPLKGLIGLGRELDLRPTTLELKNSGDTAGGRDRVVGYGGFAFEYAHSAEIEPEGRRVILDTAKAVIRRAIKTGQQPQVSLGKGVPPSAQAHRACFVTLMLEDRLRGCIGSLIPHQPLAIDAGNNAYKAAFGDQRFAPLTPEEAEKIEVSVSVLSTPRPIPAGSNDELLAQLRPDQDGLILRDGNRQALFLPSVWGGIPDARQFVHQLKRKAGLAPDHWSPTMKAFRFSAEYVADPEKRAA